MWGFEVWGLGVLLNYYIISYFLFLKNNVFPITNIFFKKKKSLVVILLITLFILSKDFSSYLTFFLLTIDLKKFK